MFTIDDLNQIAAHGIKHEQISEQLNYFKKGFPFVNIVAPANIDNKGISFIKNDEALYYTDIFERSSISKKITKFVPASGAATRMFKDLFSFSQNYTGTYVTLHKDFPEAKNIFQSLNKFAFYNDLSECLHQSGLNINDCLKSHNYTTIANYILHDVGLGYGNLPKALIKFHIYDNETRTSFEEHLIEAINYTKNKINQVFVHFTISPEHKKMFIEKLQEIKPQYEKAFNVELFVSFSEQKPQTDTIAVTENNELFRDEDGKLTFRPAGHGALLKNLNACSADIVFIKNIDNVVPDRLKGTTYQYKKICGGLLINLQNRIFDYLHALSNSQSEYLVTEIEGFAKTELLISFPNSYNQFSLQEKIAFLQEKLNRPIRVCGMVKNEGEPGGGPFWIEKNGNISLQIVESSQINHKDPVQEDLFQQSTYFNPVDLVCGIKNYKGEYFNLQKFTDSETGFISLKSKDGKTLKAQELPGLWNGAMANWITLFVEVPLITFNPVKTINDLLRAEHQPEA